MDFVKKTSDQSGPTTQQQQAPVRSNYSSNVGTTLGEDTEFSGTLKFGKSLKIEGKFRGDLTSPGLLIVGQSGQVRAEVNVGSATVEGKLTGNIGATDLVDLRSTAEVFGDINAAKIKIEEGVVFVGKAEIRPSDSKSKPLDESSSSESRAAASSAAGGAGGSSSSEKKSEAESKASK